MDNPLIPKVFTQSYLKAVVDDAIANGDVSKEHRLIFIGAVNEEGVKAIVGIQRNPFNGTLKIQGVFEHDWTGDNKATGKVVFGGWL